MLPKQVNRSQGLNDSIMNNKMVRTSKSLLLTTNYVHPKILSRYTHALQVCFTIQEFVVQIVVKKAISL